MYKGQTLARHVAYLRRLLRHKRLVFEEGRKLELPLAQLLLHDWSKFLPDEWRAGVSYYHHGTGNEVALRKHYARNRHHPQRWIRGGQSVAMPSRFRLEMLADWRAMAREKGNEVADWYSEKGHTMPLHQETRRWLESEIFGRIPGSSRLPGRKHSTLSERAHEP